MLQLELWDHIVGQLTAATPLLTFSVSGTTAAHCHWWSLYDIIAIWSWCTHWHTIQRFFLSQIDIVGMYKCVPLILKILNLWSKTFVIKMNFSDYSLNGIIRKIHLSSNVSIVFQSNLTRLFGVLCDVGESRPLAN